jgi:hypothetical protein
MQRAVQASRTLRGLKELAATTSGADGTFELDYDREAETVVFIAASVDRGDDTLAVEKPFTGEDAGELVVQREPAVVVSVTAAGAPVEGAQVHFIDVGGDESDAKTDAHGIARHATTAPRVLVTAKKDGFAAARADAALATADARVEVALVPAATILGTVRGPKNEPLAGVPVTAVDPEAPELLGSDSPIGKATTDADGHFTLDGLAPGRSYELEAVPPSLAIQRATLVFTAPANAADFALGAAGTITCDVTCSVPDSDPRLKDWPGVELQHQDGASWKPGDYERSVDGKRITFARVVPGAYRVVAHPLMFPEAQSDAVTIPLDGGTFATSITLQTGRTVTGRVVDLTGAPINRARVTRADKGMMVSMIVEGSGKFELPGITPDRYTFTVGASGYEDRQVTAEAGRNDLGDIVLTPQEKKPDSR